MVHMHNGILAIKKKIRALAATWMALEIVIPSEVRQRKRNMTSLICRV